MDGELIAQQPDDELPPPGLVDASLSPAELLSVPNRKRLTYSYVVNDEGARALRLDYGRKEVFFDEEHLFPFGEQLAHEASFTGARATTWGPGYAWDELRPLLETLLEEGILQRGAATGEARGGGLVPSQVRPSVCPVARYWSAAECEAITRELAGHPVELGNLEVFMPIYRVAHAALDADDRQVGEANVNPWLLRLDRETEWRVCQYPGTRYRDDMPMNVTALKAMIKHWKPMMATIIAVRAYVATRLAIGEAGSRGPATPTAVPADPREAGSTTSAGSSSRPWTIGELHVLSCAVLALPAYQLMKRGGSTPQRPLHPVLSSLFRITDGIRMTTSQMVTSIESPCSPGAPVTGAELYTRAEQQGLFIGHSGVCAGPKHMIDDFLAIAVDGLPAEGVTGSEIPDEVGELLSELPAAMDYGFHGMQVWALSFSVWLAMTRAYEALLEVLEAAGGEDALSQRLRSDSRAIAWKQIARHRDREIHINLYIDTYELARRGARIPVGGPELRPQLAPVPETSVHRAAADQLRGLLAVRLPARVVDRVVEVVIGYAREEQAVIAAIAPIIEAINTLLDRPRPARPIGGRDLHVHHTLRGLAEKFPYLFNSLDEALGIRIACSADTIEVIESGR